MNFRHAHASHPNWRFATELCLTQLDSLSRQPGYAKRASLGIVYMTEAYAEVASEILTFMKVRTGVADWVGTVGIAIAATGVEYVDEPALVVMLADLPAGGVTVFSGTRPPPGLDQRTASGAIAAHAALVHADPAAPDVQDLIVDMARKVESGWLFGGLSSSRGATFQIANQTFTGGGHDANVYGSGLSGAIFSSEVHLLSRITQGCHPLPKAVTHTITRCTQNVIEELDGRPSLEILLELMGLDRDADKQAIASLPSGLFTALSPTDLHADARFGDFLMRHIIGFDPVHRCLAVAARVELGQRLIFCSRDARAARADLIRICSELREEIDSAAPALAHESANAREPITARDRIRGAIYVSCIGRGAHLFGRQSAELQLIQQQLGDVPLVGFFANGEIARNQIYGYTGVLTLFL